MGLSEEQKKEDGSPTKVSASIHVRLGRRSPLPTYLA